MKKSILMAVALVAVLSLCACSGGSPNKDAEPSTTQEVKEEVVKIEKNIDAVADVLGFADGSETLYQMIGAVAGKEYNEGSVELYQFEEDSDAYKSIVNGTSAIKFTAYNEGIALLIPEGQGVDADLVEKFEAIKFK